MQVVGQYEGGAEGAQGVERRLAEGGRGRGMKRAPWRVLGSEGDGVFHIYLNKISA